jgi:hypothetical protein
MVARSFDQTGGDAQIASAGFSNISTGGVQTAFENWPRAFDSVETSVMEQAQFILTGAE